ALVTGAFDGGSDHVPPSRGVDRDQLCACRRRTPRRASNRVRDVVELEVEKDVLAEGAEGLDDLGAGPGKKLAADLVELADVAEALDHRHRQVGRWKIESDYRHWPAGFRIPRLRL